ncbi:hypothetical protein SDC9_178322 [bioreactor metagenome]|uniref:Uncharacterized protein n=1 Tax=bioreactor metagenome TaxID=1076179 RepID=A0A645GVG2_9ZZZZ
MMDFSVGLPAPAKRLPIQILQVLELSAGQKVIFHIPHQSFHLTLGLRRTNMAHLWHKSKLCGKVCEPRIPNGLSGLTPRHDGLHVVGEHILRHAAEIRKCVDNTPFETA